MLALIQRCLVVLITTLPFAFATAASASSTDADMQLSDALEQALPSLVSSEDYLSASKLYFQLAATRSRMKETAAACTALSQSLAYYRKALAKDTGAPLDEAATDSSNDEGLAEVGSKFGCVSTWPAMSDGSATASSLENVLPALLSSEDDRSASKVYFLLATARSRINETPAACAALAQSLYHYRKALARDTGTPLEEMASNSSEDDGLAEVRSKFGCASIRSELSAGLETSRH